MGHDQKVSEFSSISWKSVQGFASQRSAASSALSEEEDPHELNNVFDAPGCKEVRETLIEKIKSWEQETQRPT